MEKRLNKNVLPEVSEVDLVFRSKVKAPSAIGKRALLMTKQVYILRIAALQQALNVQLGH